MEGREAQYSLAAAPVGGGRARLQCPWAVAGPGRASRRRATTSVHQAPPVWRAPEGPEGTGVPVGGSGVRLWCPWVAAGSGCGTRGRWQGPAAVPVSGGGARPRCRWVAAGPGRASRSTTPSRQARVWRSRGQAAAHRHTQRPGPTKHHNGAPGTPAAPQATQRQAPHQRAQAYKKPTSGSDVGLWWS